MQWKAVKCKSLRLWRRLSGDVTICSMCPDADTLRYTKFSSVEACECGDASAPRWCVKAYACTNRLVFPTLLRLVEQIRCVSLVFWVRRRLKTLWNESKRLETRQTDCHFRIEQDYIGKWGSDSMLWVVLRWSARCWTRPMHCWCRSKVLLIWMPPAFVWENMEEIIQVFRF